MKNVFLYLFFNFICLNSFCQFKIIKNPLGGNDLIKSIIKSDTVFYINAYQQRIFKCSNNCDTVAQIPTMFANGFNIHSISSIHPDTIFAATSNFGASKGKFYKTENAGLQWEELIEIDGEIFYSMAMIKNKYGVIGGDFGNFFLTENGGLNWQTSSGWGSATFSVAEPYGDSTFYLSGNGFVQRSNNFFQTSQSGYFGFYEPGGLHIINQDTLVMCATGNAQNNKSMMSYSINGGSNWTRIEYSTGIYFNDLYFKNKNEGYIVGYKFLGINKGIILKTTDFGQSFTEIITPFNVQLSKIEFINDSIALLGSTNGLLVQWNTKIPITTSLEKIETNPFVIYPNPATNILSIENSNSLINQILIQNSIGENVKEFKNANQVSNQLNLDISSLPSGLYFIKIKDYNGIENTQKFIKLN